MRPRDTSPEAWKVLMDLIRAMPPEVRLQRCLELSELVCRFGEAGIRQAYPQAGEREIFLRVASRKLGPELFRTVYGDELAAYGSA
jgi:hypothetical protein